METLTRLLSWAFVFGALATLLTTSLRPVWKDIASTEVTAEQVQGTTALPGDRALGDGPLTAKRDCPETPTGAVSEGCPDTTP